MAKQTSKRILKMALQKGTILDFSGSWGSGMGFLKVKLQNGTIKSIPCDNAETVRSLEAAFGDTISEGHTVKKKGAYVGKKISFAMTDWGTMEGFNVGWK